MVEKIETAEEMKDRLNELWDEMTDKQRKLAVHIIITPDHPYWQHIRDTING